MIKILKNTIIKVKGSKKADNEISPYIFSHFIEDIRDFMDGMLAYVLKDMDFEEEDICHRGVSGSWYPVTNGKNTKYALEPAAYLHSGNSQKISMISDDCAYSGIAQRISVKGNVEYSIKMYARSSPELNNINIEIFDCEKNKRLAGTVVQLPCHDWQECECRLEISEDCSNAEFRVGVNSAEYPWRDSVSTGMLWIDHVSMLPADNVAYVKKEVYEYIEALNPRMLRFGGNVISAYHWKYGVGPFYQRPNMYNEAWGGMSNKYFGTDEFIELCRKLDAEPMICINAGSGTPEEAVQWIEYCNGASNTPMGALRAKNGHAEPYNVQYWQVGNEIFGEWQVGHCNAEEYGKRCAEFSREMKEADPGILLIGCGDVVPEWNGTLLEKAGEYLDYVAIHIYHCYGRLGMDKSSSDEEKFKGIVSFPEVTRHILNATTDIINSNPKYQHIKYAITEYNTMYLPNTIRKGLPDEHTLEAGVAVAANLNEFIRNSSMVAITNFSDLVNGWTGGCIRVGDSCSDQSKGRVPGWSGKDSVVYGTPAYYILQIYAQKDIAYMVDTDINCEKYSVEAKGNDVDLIDLPIIDSVACLNRAGTILTLFAVNRSLEDVEVHIELDGFNSGKEVEMWKLTGEHYRDINHALDTGNIKPETSKAEGRHFVLKAHSVYAFDFKLLL